MARRVTEPRRKLTGAPVTQYKHGRSRTPEYRAWINMRSRCENPNFPFWKDWGGRGIKICPEWRSSFERFYADMGPRPGRGFSLDRIDCDGDYTPENCRWATQRDQMRNVRRNRIVEVDGIVSTLAEAVEIRGLKYNTVLYRIRRGATPQEALR